MEDTILNDKVLRRLQITEFEILSKVDKMCRMNGLQYFLVGGTLLGAVRHGGFIPWDDDLDIAMPRKDYNKFLQLCVNGGLEPDLYLQHNLTENDYWLPFAKIRKKNTLFEEAQYQDIECMKGIFIDVFPLDFCEKNDGIIYHLKSKSIKKLTAVIQMRRLRIQSPSFLTSVLFILTKPLTINCIARIRDLLCTKCQDGKFVINYGSNYKYTKQTMPKSYYFPCAEVEFEGKGFMAPGEYFNYLEQLFSNWKQLPPEEERRNHNPATIYFDLMDEKEKYEE